ncbi:hypothetical protein DEO72_LG4g978 [Vigna unguiculata]|uniref:Uncharacterized protein n=1 Tax=Vigna unguiculata TaxID=3917 RepID=A0A4D6LPC1_VIGUN|nr:hypothetical protein DEO72_LG4g978 [Vigna unguiculata]
MSTSGSSCSRKGSFQKSRCDRVFFRAFRKLSFDKGLFGLPFGCRHPITMVIRCQVSVVVVPGSGASGSQDPVKDFSDAFWKLSFEKGLFRVPSDCRHPLTIVIRCRVPIVVVPESGASKSQDVVEDLF